MSIFTIDNKNKFDPFSKDFWVRMLIMTIVIWIISATSLVKVQNPLYALIAAIIISLLNSFIRPLLSWISLPLIIGTFGIFIFVINAIIVLITSELLKPGFQVVGFWNAFFFSIIVTFLSFLMNIPRKIKRVSDDIFTDMDDKNYGNSINDKKDSSASNNTNNKSNSPNQNKDNRFDDDPFNDNPQEKNYTDFEEVEDDKPSDNQ